MPIKKRPDVYDLVQQIIQSIICVAVFLLLFRLLTDESIFIKNDLFLVIIVLASFELYSLMGSIKTFTTLHGIRPENLVLRRMTLNKVACNFLLKAPSIVVLAISCNRFWTFPQVGFSPEYHWAGAIIVGMCSAIVLPKFVSCIFRSPARTSRGKFSAFDVVLTRSLLPRGLGARRLLFVWAVVVWPVLEELIYRGFFVFALSVCFESIIAGICIGFLLDCWAHLHQGPENLKYRPFFFAATVSLLYSPFGLLSAIAFHCVWNARYMFQLNSHANYYLKFVKDCRRSKSFVRLSKSQPD